MFEKILIANRGEVACRIIRTCNKLGIRTVAVFSEADADALHVQMADEAYLLGPAKVQESYLNVEKVLEVVQTAGAQALHPGYGLLSENAYFAEKCSELGIIFIGPSPHIIRKMGSKIEARTAMEAAGIPVIPGLPLPYQNEDEAVKAAEQLGYPVMLKASAGGGGIGMELASTEQELRKAFAGNKKRAANFFGNDTMYIEKAIRNPRHIEIQIAADQDGNCVHLGERDCSIQRRHQKVVEESPAPTMKESLRKKMGETAVQAATALRYTNIGTLEFLVEPDGTFYFLEMNTRLQVEHPVTEEVTGVDLVEEQLRIAAGEKLLLSQKEIGMKGASIEARIYAEDPVKFFPSPGTITKWLQPELTGIRHECWVREGTKVTPYYDPLLAKVIATHDGRAEAIQLLVKALKAYEVEGIKTNIPFLIKALEDETFQAGKATTSFIQDVQHKTLYKNQ
ncbi:acetyl-CoA carboxylase biotin carboxylase subunit [Salsuginibacillus kocurii]|uniref:acetyl-CoA carboxylase biotin carboxylase subunit n=1 Tax=Salsuginibacillus kocurii TaxID=427078 RepID=UPI00037ED9D9|nr:acetyl-CoA carboxylase biotin carboxylase subunit [Salsuginibacillus kocurii]